MQVVVDFHGNLQQNPKYIDIFTDGNQIFITFLRPNTSKESYEGFTTNQIPLWSPIFGYLKGLIQGRIFFVSVFNELLLAKKQFFEERFSAFMITFDL